MTRCDVKWRLRQARTLLLPVVVTSVAAMFLNCADDTVSETGGGVGVDATSDIGHDTEAVEDTDQLDVSTQDSTTDVEEDEPDVGDDADEEDGGEEVSDGGADLPSDTSDAEDSGGADVTDSGSDAPSDVRDDTDAPAPTLTALSPAELLAELDTKTFPLINVHVPYEGEIEGTDTHIDYREIDDLVTYIGTDLDRRVVIYCKSNYMALIAGNALLDRGYRHIEYLDGGMIGWQNAGYTIINE